MKKGFTLVELLAVIIILGLLTTFILPNITKLIDKKSGEIDEVTKQLVLLSARNYLNNYDNFTIEKDNYCIDIQTLIANNYLDKSLDELYSYKYVYASYNGKSTNYELLKDSCHLADVVKSKYDSTKTYGLLKDSTGYYYKGTSTQVNNNYVFLNDMLWRIVSIDNNNEITLILEDNDTNMVLNTSVWTNTSTYNTSLINKYLNDETDSFYKKLKSSVRNKLLSTNYNVGTYSNPSSIVINTKIGLLDYNQFTKSKSTDSYLKTSTSFALGSIGSGCIYIINSSGNATCSSISTSYDIRPVIKISDLATSPDQDGTLSNPYGKI